jgi:hypothetical protein
MKKLAILASVLMIVTAPIMAQLQGTAFQEESRLGDTATEYGVSFDGEDSKKPGQKGIRVSPTEVAPYTSPTDLFLELLPADTNLLEVPAGDLKQPEEESEQLDPSGEDADNYKIGGKTSTFDAPFNRSPSLVPALR